MAGFGVTLEALIEAEEHNPKLVYVQRLLWKRFGHRSLFRIAAGNFTNTPKIFREIVELTLAI